MRTRNFEKVVVLRCRETDLVQLDRLCEVLGTTRSAFLREKIENILTTLNFKDYAKTRI